MEMIYEEGGKGMEGCLDAFNSSTPPPFIMDWISLAKEWPERDVFNSKHTFIHPSTMSGGGSGRGAPFAVLELDCHCSFNNKTHQVMVSVGIEPWWKRKKHLKHHFLH